MPQEVVCINGQIVPADQAGVSVFDAGFMQGVGLFETMRAYGGRVFRLERHLDRLANSARELGWTLIPDHEQMIDCVNAVMDQFAGQDARVRLTVTTGSLRAEAGAVRLTMVATASPGGKYADTFYEQGSRPSFHATAKAALTRSPAIRPPATSGGWRPCARRTAKTPWKRYG